MDAEINKIDPTVWGLPRNYLSPIMHLFDDPEITEIMVNNFETVFVKKRGKMVAQKSTFKDEHQVETAIRQVGVAIGETLSDDKPILEARLWDGSRFCGVMKPYSSRGSGFTIRLFPKTALTTDDLISYGSVTQPMLDYLRLAVLTSSNILIAGSTDSGKTTLLNALTDFIPPEERVILVEDTAEIRADLPNVVSLVVFDRPKNAKYKPVDLAQMIKTTLRMNPSRVIVGEIRDSIAALSFMRTLNIGSNGCMASIHANDPRDAIARITDLLVEQGIPTESAERQVCANLHVIVQAEEIPNVGRKIVSIAEVSREGGVKTLYQYDYRKQSHFVEEEALSDSSVRTVAFNRGLI